MSVTFLLNVLEIVIDSVMDPTFHMTTSHRSCPFTSCGLFCWFGSMAKRISIVVWFMWQERLSASTHGQFFLLFLARLVGNLELASKSKHQCLSILFWLLTVFCFQANGKISARMTRSEHVWWLSTLLTLTFVNQNFQGPFLMGKGRKLLFHPKWFTHKFEGPRVMSEVAICMQLDKAVWIGNTVPCGVWPDKKIC